MSSYRVVLTPEATRSIAKLPDKVRAAVVEAIRGSIAENPHRAGRPLAGELRGLHSARRGDFRVIYRIDRNAGEVVILRAHHRADVYRRR